MLYMLLLWFILNKIGMINSEEIFMGIVNPASLSVMHTEVNYLESLNYKE